MTFGAASFNDVNTDSNFTTTVLPTEIITEILLRLPVKLLLKFRSVSKSWLGLISSHKFVNTHLNISSNNKAFHRLILGFGPPENNLKDCSVNSLFYDNVTRAIDLDYPPKKSYQSIKVVGSVNGVICVAIEQKDLFMWNPSIRKLKKMPSSRTGSFYMYGFGYDELHDDYKVVDITLNVGDDNSYYNVGKMYSLNNNSWKHLDDLQIAMSFNNSGMLVNVKLHWAITNKYSGYYNDCVIFVVDLANGRWEEMENPCYGEGNFDFMPYLGVLGNDLSMICHPLMTHVDVWVMKEYGDKESWTKMFNIRCVGYSFFGPHFCISSEGEILFKNGSNIIICNPKDDSMQFQEVTNCGQLVDAKLYIESLVWPFVVEHTRNATTSEATHN
ncbi:F-box/kelch-repeat protein At3g23880-like [Solanum stenotomum]|uniref:F-box/kelch-repeat protein At3g23880-like n=1 Tax=Solanum stenotomum TaxID=172797 RepID=UPI0020D05A92|nr:F-box/kelch-repeat protein At3g23880-like [Solanum stenotomum]